MYMYKKDINQMSSVAFVISSAYFWLVHHHLPQYLLQYRGYKNTLYFILQKKFEDILYTPLVNLACKNIHANQPCQS